MAAPVESTMQNLTGKWALNKDLSDNPDPVFVLQGIGYLTRKAIGLAPVTLEFRQFEAPPKPPNTATDPVTHLYMTQLAAGLKGVQEDRCLDNEARDHSDWLFGTTTTQSRWATLDEIEDEYLKDGWLIDDEEHSLVLTVARSKANGWTATQVWGFRTVNGERRYCRRVLAVKGNKRAMIQMVHNFIS